MARLTSSKSLILRSTCRLITNKVGPCSAKTSRTYCLMSIYHNLVISSLFNSILIMINHSLSIMMFTFGYYITNITTFNSLISIIHHKLICLIHTTFIIAYSTRCFVMHNHLYASGLGIIPYFRQIKIRIGGNKIKYIFLKITKPIFPTDIPSLN